MVSGASSHATTHKTLCSTNAWAGFWPELSVPRRLHHHKCSSWAGSSSCSHSILSCSLYGRKVAESFTLLFVCLQTPHCLKALLQVSIVFMAKLCSMKFHFYTFFPLSLHDFCVWEATTDFPCGFLQHCCNNCLHC